MLYKGDSVVSRRFSFSAFFAYLLFSWGAVPAESAASELYTSRSHTGVLILSDVKINHSSRLYSGPSPSHFRSFHPGRYSYKDFHSLISRSAHSYGVSPALVRSVIETESAFDPKAVSKAGAIGLMQIMPQTARSLGIDPWKPSENIEGGTRYLKKLMNRYHNNLRHSLAAYNAGVKNVDRYGGVPPFKETQAYVRKVLKRYAKYKRNERRVYRKVSFVPLTRKKKSVELELSSFPVLKQEAKEQKLKRGNVSSRKRGNTIEFINLYD